jgi:hypothetical protein
LCIISLLLLASCCFNVIDSILFSKPSKILISNNICQKKLLSFVITLAFDKLTLIAKKLFLPFILCILWIIFFSITIFSWIFLWHKTNLKRKNQHSRSISNLNWRGPIEWETYIKFQKNSWAFDKPTLIAKKLFLPFILCMLWTIFFSIIIIFSWIFLLDTNQFETKKPTYSRAISNSVGNKLGQAKLCQTWAWSVKQLKVRAWPMICYRLIF